MGGEQMTVMFISSLVLVIALVVFFGWLAVRARQARRAVVKWPGAVVSGLLAVVCAGGAGLALLGLYRVYIPDAAPAASVEIAGTPEQLARGERLANLCTGCHSSSGELPLDGGSEIDLAGLGRVYPPNLTPGGPLQEWSDEEIIRAIREGVNQDGRSLLIMPSDQYHHMSDADVQALVAYLRTQPAVDHETPEMELNLFGWMLLGTGIFPLSVQPALRTPVQPPPDDATPAHGAYLVAIAGCRACHGEDLRGGTSQFTPIGPNLPAIVAQWSAGDFVTTMQTGVDPYGHSLNADTMPWDEFAAAFNEQELRAIYAYLRSLAPAVDAAHPEPDLDQSLDLQRGEVP